MAVTSSNNFALGTRAPDFELPDVRSNKTVPLQEVRSDQATVIMFICNHCPYVKHVKDELVRLALDYQPKGVSFVAISANDATQYPEDSPERMKETADAWGFTFPYLYDESQAVAKAYDAVCTPDFYVFDKKLQGVYHGQLDDSRPKNDKPVTGRDLRSALDAVLSDKAVNKEQVPSVGCSIKWK